MFVVTTIKEKRRLPSLLVRWLGPRKTRDSERVECLPTQKYVVRIRESLLVRI